MQKMRISTKLREITKTAESFTKSSSSPATPNMTMRSKKRPARSWTRITRLKVKTMSEPRKTTRSLQTILLHQIKALPQILHRVPLLLQALTIPRQQILGSRWKTRKRSRWPMPVSMLQTPPSSKRKKIATMAERSMRSNSILPMANMTTRSIRRRARSSTLTMMQKPMPRLQAMPSRSMKPRRSRLPR